MIKLPEIKGEYKYNYILKNLTWFKVGGPAEVLFKPLDQEDLINFLLNLKEEYLITVLGACSNIIIRDGGMEGIVIKLGKNFNNIELFENKIKVGSACLNYNLSHFAYEHSLTGLEFLVGIPGTIGGGIAMNAGAYGHEFKDNLLEIEVVDFNGNTSVIPNHEINFKHRGNGLADNLIYLSATFKLKPGDKEEIDLAMKKITSARSATQPVKEKTGGSTFVNPLSIVSDKKAWQLIDEAGMRGYKVGDASMSTLHCNFMINNGEATAADLENLGEEVKAKVFDNSGVALTWEIKRLGKKDE